MQNNLLQDIPKEQRFKHLGEMAVKTQTEKVRRQYSEDEILQMKDFVSEESISLLEKDEEFAAIKKEFNAAIKKFKDQIKDALKSLKRKYSEQEETVFLMDDQEAGLMHIYDQEGVFLYSRKLYADERQLTTLSKVG